MAEKKKSSSFIKAKSTPGAQIGFKTSNFVRTQAFKPGGARIGFNPGSFKQTQHKG